MCKFIFVCTYSENVAQLREAVGTLEVSWDSLEFWKDGNVSSSPFICPRQLAQDRIGYPWVEFAAL